MFKKISKSCKAQKTEKSQWADICKALNIYLLEGNAKRIFIFVL